jgi:hypothetical protein
MPYRNGSLAGHLYDLLSRKSKIFGVALSEEKKCPEKLKRSLKVVFCIVLRSQLCGSMGLEVQVLPGG